MIKALTLIEPWATLIVKAGKNPENRRWPTRERGWFLLHTAQQMTEDDHAGAVTFARAAGYEGPIPAYAEVQRGVILGAAKLTGCVHYDEQKRKGMDLRWSMPAQYGFFMSDVIALPLVKARGTLNFWQVRQPEREKILAQCERFKVALPADLAAMLGAADAEPKKKQMGLFDE